jgi:hypothetical protein
MGAGVSILQVAVCVTHFVETVSAACLTRHVESAHFGVDCTRKAFGALSPGLMA